MLANILFERSELSFKSLQALQEYFASHGEYWAVQVMQEQLNNNGQKSGVVQQSHRSSGRTAMRANLSVHEPKSTKQKANYINFSMEGAKTSSVSDMPFTWAPGWNSNQSVFQYQRQVNDDLQHQALENRLTFIVNEQLEKSCETLWANELVTRSNTSHPSSSHSSTPHSNNSIDELTFIQNLPWYLQDAQARIIPEFIMRYSGNEIEMTSELAKQNGWQAQQVLKLIVNSMPVMAKIILNEGIPSSVILGCFFELPQLVNNSPVKVSQITLASEQEEIDFHQQQVIRFQQAQTEKEMILARLKKQDQHLAISFVDMSNSNTNQEESDD